MSRRFFQRKFYIKKKKNLSPIIYFFNGVPILIWSSCEKLKNVIRTTPHKTLMTYALLGFRGNYLNIKKTKKQKKRQTES